MDEPFLGSVALASGALTRHALRTRCVRLHRDVYISHDTELTALVRAQAAWLACRGGGVLAGLSAAAVHGAGWTDPRMPATIIGTDHRRPSGIAVCTSKLAAHESCVVDGMRVTTPVRTVVDLARRHPLDSAVAAIDSLANATGLTVADMYTAAGRYPDRQGRKRALQAISFVDPGSSSAQQTWLRLLIMRAGYPRPESQIPIHDQRGALLGTVGLGWRDLRIGVEYESTHRRGGGPRVENDIRRIDELLEQRWIVIRVTAADTDATVARRVAEAWASRTRASRG
jgi:hypothetical protein